MANGKRVRKYYKEVPLLTTRLDHLFAELAFAPYKVGQKPWQRKADYAMKGLIREIEKVLDQETWRKRRMKKRKAG